MDLKHLRTFLHVAELGSLSKAADRLRIAQPALSRQVRLLESELKVQLFTRHGRGMVLTEAGATLRRRTEGIFRQLQDVATEVGADATAVRGAVVLGAVPTIGDLFAGRIVQRFIAEHPQVAMRVVAGYSGHLVDWLQRGELDLAVLYDTTARNNVRLEPLLIETLFLVGRGDAGHRVPHAVSFMDVARRRLVLPSARHGLRHVVEREARLRGLTLDVPVEADSFRILHDLVAGGFGETILPLAAVRQEVEAGRLSVAPIIDPPLSRRLGLALPGDRPLTTAVRRFADHVRREVAALVASGAIDGRLLSGQSEGSSDSKGSPD